MTKRFDIKAIRARGEAATEGNWTTKQLQHEGFVFHHIVIDAHGDGSDITDLGEFGLHEDAELAANARTDIPDMADWIEEAEHVMAELMDAARYTPEYFRTKWGIDETIKAAEVLLAGLDGGE